MLGYCKACSKERQEKKAKHKRYELYLDALVTMKAHGEVPWCATSPDSIDLILSSVRHQLNATRE